MNKQTLHITLIQTTLEWENKRANLSMLESKICSITDTDLIVLPEMFTTGFSMNNVPLAENWNGSYTKWWMQEISKTVGADLVGSFIVKENEKYYNRLAWVTPEGEVFHYDKRHLFSLAGEHNYYTPGKDRVIIERFGWKFMPLICYDVRFPIWSRNDLDIDTYIYIANFPAKRKKAWISLLQARAIENQSYVIGVNIVGNDGKNIEYKGGSFIFDFEGESVLDCGEESNIQSLSLSKESQHTFRSKFDFLQDRDKFTVE